MIHGTTILLAVILVMAYALEWSNGIKGLVIAVSVIDLVFIGHKVIRH